MVIKKISTFGTETGLASGGTGGVTHEFDYSGTLKYIVVADDNNASVAGILLTITLAGETKTNDLAPGHLFDPNTPGMLECGWEVEKGQR